MAIGTTAALLIGGGLVGSAALSSGAARSAGSQVSQATDSATAEQRRQFDTLVGLQRPAYDRGEAAAGIYSRALGIPSMTGGSTASGTGQAGMMTGGRDYNRYLNDNADVRTAIQGGGFGGAQGEGGLAGAAQRHYEEYGQREGRSIMDAPTDQSMIGDQVRNTPGYQNQLDQGLKSIDRAAPLVGGMYSGRRMKALNDYGQNTFGSYYQNWLGQVGGVAGQGTQAGQNIGQAGMQFANNAGGLMVQGANARGQASVNSANAWSGAIGTGIGLYGGSQGWFGR